MSESAGKAFFEIPVDWICWKRAGQVQLDQSGCLAFPRVDAVPGIYRFTIEDGTTNIAQYVGQAARSLRTRSSLYRSRGKRPALPLERKTISRNARYLLDALTSARTVWVDLADDQATGPDGQILVINFAGKALRSKLEKGLILQACQADSKVLNRDGNPRWGDARSV